MSPHDGGDGFPLGLLFLFLAWVMVHLFGCTTILHPKPTPDDACLVPCENALHTSEVAYLRDGNVCSCVDENDTFGETGDIVSVSLDGKVLGKRPRKR